MPAQKFDSKSFPPTTCPECRSRMPDKVTCRSCGGYGVVSHFKAAMLYSQHPEWRTCETPQEMPAVKEEPDEK
jgi:DnaJ-class molecular chaperone